jgi:hypothetical protein
MPLGELRLLQARTAGGSHNAPRFSMEACPRKASRGEVSEEDPGHLIIASYYRASQLAHIPLILKLYFFTLTKATHQFYLCIRSMNLGGCIFKIVLCSRERPTPAKLANGTPHLESSNTSKNFAKRKAALCFGFIKEFRIPRCAESPMTPHYAEESLRLMRDCIRSFHLLGFEDDG